jgi:hypothetical protein
VSNKRKKTFETKSKSSIFEDPTIEEVIVPDEALTYIIANYLNLKNKDGVLAMVGISPHTVETVLQLLIDWGALRGHVKNGVLHLGEPRQKE